MSSDALESRGSLLPPSEALGGEFVLPPAAPGPESAGPVERLALCVGPLRLLCAIEIGREVVPPPVVSRLPHVPSWLTGVANVRGTLVAVLDPAEALGLQRPQTARRYLLVFGASGATLGLLVDDLPVPRVVDTSERIGGVPPHPDMLKGYVHGAYELDGEVWLDVDLEGFFEMLGERMEG